MSVIDWPYVAHGHYYISLLSRISLDYLSLFALSFSFYGVVFTPGCHGELSWLSFDCPCRRRHLSAKINALFLISKWLVCLAYKITVPQVTTNCSETKNKTKTPLKKENGYNIYPFISTFSRTELKINHAFKEFRRRSELVYSPTRFTQTQNLLWQEGANNKHIQILN